MLENYNTALILGAGLSAIAAALHVAIVIGGSSWYRFFGAGEQFASAAENGRWWPAIITLGIACMLGLWAAYALSGAGVIHPLPFLKLALVLITSLYLLRGLVLVPALLFARSSVTPFVFWSSAICIGYGAFHLLRPRPNLVAALIEPWRLTLRSSGTCQKRRVLQLEGSAP